MRAVFAIWTVAVLTSGCTPGSEVSRQLGARCDVKEECDERCLPPDPAFPGGFCTTTCLEESDCPARASCADIEGGVCLFNCVEDTHCEFLGEGWTCQMTTSPDGVVISVCVGSN